MPLRLSHVSAFPRQEDPAPACGSHAPHWSQATTAGGSGQGTPSPGNPRLGVRSFQQEVNIMNQGPRVGQEGVSGQRPDTGADAACCPCPARGDGASPLVALTTCPGPPPRWPLHGLGCSTLDSHTHVQQALTPVPTHHTHTRAHTHTHTRMLTPKADRGADSLPAPRPLQEPDRQGSQASLRATCSHACAWLRPHPAAWPTCLR